MTKDNKPPRLAEWFMKGIFPDGGKYSTLGDLEEVFQGQVKEKGYFRAYLWYWLQVLKSIRPFTKGFVVWRLIMLKNCHKVTIRNLMKYKTFTLINVFGLILGMTCCIVIFKFVQGETGWDTTFPNKERLYRLTVASEVLSTGERQTWATSPLLWAPAMEKLYPEIEKTTRMVFSYDPILIESGHNHVEQGNVFYTEESVFELFGWRLDAGDPQKVFLNPNDVVLTWKCAKKYFGDENPMGKILLLVQQERNARGEIVEKKIPLTVRGLMQDVPRKTHVKPEMLISFITLNDLFGGDVQAGSHPNPDFWRWTIGYTYLLLRDNYGPVQFEEKIPQFLKDHVGDANISRGFRYLPYLQNVSKIHLEKQVQGTPELGTDKDHLYFYSIIAFFILIVACFNFINLSTARAGKRSLEVGIRKVVGSSRRDLIGQFLGESVLLSLVALILALFLSEFVGSLFSHYTGKEIVLLPREIPIFILSLAGILLFTGVLAGGYPAFLLSAFRPSSVLKKTHQSGMKGAFIRKTLVILQFTITIFFIIGAMTIRKQLSFMRKQDLGFQGSNVFVLSPVSNAPLYDDLEAFKNELMRHSTIEAVTFSSVIPGRMWVEDLWVKKDQPGQGTSVLYEVETDYDFIDLYGLELVAGRQFEKKMGTDGMRDIPSLEETGDDFSLREEEGVESLKRPKEVGIVLNEKAVGQLDLDDPTQALGQVLVRDPVSVDFYGRVVGVVRNFHFESLKADIQPLVMFLHDPSYPIPMEISIKVSNRELPQTRIHIEKRWREFFPEATHETFFIDAHFGRLYEQEQRIFEIFCYGTLLTVLIACLGLFGLILFVIEQKTKEIGIRKILGASMPHIFLLFSKGYIKLILISNLIAWPVSYFFLNKWLQSFAYRASFNPWIFIFTAFIAFFIAMATIWFQVFQVARARPVEALRYE